MGINREYVATLLDLRGHGQLATGATIVDLGAQVISASPASVGRMMEGARLDPSPIETAADLYHRLGFSEYVAIDASGEYGSLAYDLNRDLIKTYGFDREFDVVTNLGTLEHCFNQAAAFRTMHRLCRPSGLMIHCLPTQGLVNHGFYNYHPRFVADLAAANNYDIERLFFTKDFTDQMFPYLLASFRENDDRDLMLYAVLRRTSDHEFQMPYDGMFSAGNKVGYSEGRGQSAVLSGEFAPYIKTSWDNVRSTQPVPPRSFIGSTLRRLAALRLRRQP